jgi:hypothetical protein
MSTGNSALRLPEKLLVFFSKIADFYYVFDRYFNLYNSYPDEAHWGILSLLCGPDYQEKLPKVKQVLVDNAFKRVEKKAADFPGCIAFIRHLRSVLEVLVRDPILADSGTHEPIYDKPRTYADVQHQVANELVGLKNGIARVKLPTGEYTIRTLRPNTPKKIREAAQEKQQRIQERTRQYYCTPRFEVEEQIRKRQEMPEPPTTQRKHTV